MFKPSRLLTPALLAVVLSPRPSSAQQTSQAPLPDVPSATLLAETTPYTPPVAAFPIPDTSSSLLDEDFALSYQTTATPSDPGKPKQATPVDANGNPIPLDRQQPQRILGFMPNFRSVSAGSKPHPPGWKYNFKIATRQAFDYSSFGFLGLTSLTAEGLNQHPKLGKGADGFYAYTWRGFIDKTDGTFLSAWLLASLLHEDTRFYPLGSGHRIVTRELYVISRQGVARTYGGRQTPNIAGLGGKVLTQTISKYYYPAGTTDFSVLATKFGYSVMRDVIFSNIREFYPDIAAHYIRKHQEKAARLSAQDVNSTTH